jgi:Flp pilus assembly protein TadD
MLGAESFLASRPAGDHARSVSAGGRILPSGRSTEEPDMKRSLPRLTLLVAAIAATGCATQTWTASPTIVPDTAVRTTTVNADGQYQIGKRKLTDGDAAGALAAFDRALRLDPQHLDARNGRATALARMGQVDAAIAELRGALVDAPRGAHLHNNLGYLLMTQSRLEEAAVALRAATNVEPDNPRYRANWAALARHAPALTAPVAAEGPAMPASATEVVKPSPPPASSEISGAVLNISWAEVDATSRDASVPPQRPTIPMSGGSPAVITLPNVAQQVPPVRASPTTLRLEVSNGGGVNGAARRTAVALRNSGIPIARVTNHTDFRQPSTSIRYRDGMRDAAAQLQARLGLPESALVRDDRLPSGVDAKLLLGRDAMRAGLGTEQKLHADAVEALRREAAALSTLLDASPV